VKENKDEVEYLRHPPRQQISMTSKPTIEAALKLLGENLQVERAEAMISLKATKTWRQGDSVPGTSLKRKENAWVLAIPERETLDAEECVAELLGKIAPHRTEIASVLALFEASAVISLAIYPRESIPACFLTAAIISQIADLGANLDVDVMSLGESH